ncbi:MAG: hypothetical protein COB61_011265 [Thiotrichales bacterium]|nr:hypothetical protein [Thiotrichales bacterium]
MNKNLKNWANSFSGCDGGNIKADTWLCGIEWGYSDGTEEEKQNYYTNELPEEIGEGAVKLNSSYNFFTDESLVYPFNRGFAKLYAAYKGDDVGNYNAITGQLLKLNISPIGFWKDEEYLWDKYNLSKTTGFDVKEYFVSYLNSLNRFTEIRNNHKPKLIVCVGVGRRNDFLRCFFGNKDIDFKKTTLTPQSESNKNTRNIYYSRYDETLIVVVPFFTSSNGLNSDYLLQKTGDAIAKLLKNV